MRSRSRAFLPAALAAVILLLTAAPALAAETANSEFVIIRSEDVLEDDFPVLEVEPTLDGTYTVEVAMITCSAEPCYWGVQAYVEVAEPTGAAGLGPAAISSSPG